jgi:PhnB protein
MTVIPDKQLDQIMDISLPLIDGGMIIGSDIGGEWSAKTQKGNNFSISLACKSNEEVANIFMGLCEGGKVTMPIEKTFWNSYFGRLTDKFGYAWLANCELKQEK